MLKDQNGSQIMMCKILLELFGEVWQYHQTLKNKFAIHLREDFGVKTHFRYCIAP
jgi:hypothetical protein